VRVLLSWLREFAPIEGDPSFIGDQMSDLGMAVESMAVMGEGLADIVVARVAALRPHPDADRIQIVDVDAGDGELRQVCCGAFNMAAGDLVPLAPVGATLPGGMAIGRRKMRGQWSEGMLCSADELGLASDHDGIMVLDDAVVADPSALAPGQALVDALGLDGDVVYELEINPNRPDAMSVAGVARDLAARLGVPFTLPDPQVATTGADAATRVTVEVVDADLCGRFTAIVLDDVVVGPSPSWLADRLRAMGMRPVNNVVDISNYVMWELGAPNHAYDADRLAGPGLRARWARPGETVVTLDGVERTLADGDGVVADADDVPVAIAGVMGGASTEIGPNTTSVIVEFAWWDPMTIARSSRRLGLRSEASARFERGCDPEVAELAARRFAELAVAAGATLAPGMVVAHGDVPVPARVAVRTARVNTLLGTELDAGTIAGVLEPIGFVAAVEGSDVTVAVPPWRPDTTTETDVVEEVARHIGYSALPSRRPARATTGGLDARQLLRRQLRSLLVGLGACEAMPTPLLSADDLAAAGLPGAAVTITNPLAAEESLLRPSLRPGLLRAVAYNTAHRNPVVRLFEVGRVFTPPANGDILPTETEMLAVVLSGRDGRAAVGVLDVVADALGVDVDLVAAAPDGMHPTRTAEVHRGAVVVGVVGEVDPEVVDRMGLVGPVGWLELDIDALAAGGVGQRTYRAVSRFPSADVDLAFELAEVTAASALRAAITEAAGELLVGLELFDVYRGDGVAERSRSLAHRLRLQASDRTLTDAEVAEVRQRVVDHVAATLGATLR
jgi:phenylalanyl-tRNA synthetase beta chain